VIPRPAQARPAGLPLWILGSLLGALVAIATLTSPTTHRPASTVSEGATSEKIEQVLVIGLDAADWGVLSPMMQRGELPHLARLAREGRGDFLYTTKPMISPAIWTSLATGRTRQEHGIHHFAYKPLDDYDLVEYRGIHRRVRAIWDIVSAAGKSVSVLDYMTATPAEPVAGVMVSDLHSAAEPSTYPTDLFSTLDDRCLVTPQQGKSRDDLSPSEHVEDLNTRLERTRRLALCLLERRSTDLFVVYTHTTDAVQHLFWKYAFPEQFSTEYWDLAEVAGSGLEAVLEQHWRNTDEMVGDLLDQVGPSTLTLIVSDHGATASTIPRDALRIEQLLATMGWLAHGSGGERDLSRTLAYDATAVPRNPAISLNLRGREPEGIVSPEKFDSLLGALIDDLRAIETTDGDRFFSEVEAISIVSDENDPSGHSARDIRCVVNDEMYRPRNSDAELLIPRIVTADASEPTAVQAPRETVTAQAQDLLRPVSYSGKHRDPGVIIAHGPGIHSGSSQVFRESALKRLAGSLGVRLGLSARKPKPGPSIMDITPTLLWTLGLPVARDMAGAPATGLFTEEYVEAHPVTWIKTYEEGHDRRPAEPEDAEAASSEMEAERLRYLRALGYVN